jgi:hypothetical protein
MFQSDWTEKDKMSPAFIRNKPDINQDGSVDLSGIESDIEALRDKIGSLHYKTVHMVNHTRGCMDINTPGRRLEITDEVYVYADDAKRVLSIEPSVIDWITGEYPDNDTYYVIVDGVESSPDSPVYVIGGNSDTDDWPGMENPVYVGMFYVKEGEVQGLSFCSDDVKVDGRYIYDNAVSLDISGNATFLGETRGDMNIDTVNKVVTLANSAVVITDSGRYTIPAGSYAWNKGNAAEYYENIYTVYADIAVDDLKKLSVVAAGVSFIPMERAYRIGAFYWTGSVIGGINFENDVYVDGAYIYGSGGGSGSGISDAPSDNYLYARSNGAWVKTVSIEDFNRLTRDVRRLYNLFDKTAIREDSRIRLAYGAIESNSGTVVSGDIPVAPDALYAIEGVDLVDGKVRVACLDGSGNVLRATNPDGTYISDSGYEVYAGGFKVPSAAVSLYFQIKLYNSPSGYNGLDSVYIYKT